MEMTLYCTDRGDQSTIIYRIARAAVNAAGLQAAANFRCLGSLPTEYKGTSEAWFAI